MYRIIMLLSLCPFLAQGVTVTDAFPVTGNYLSLEIQPKNGATVRQLGIPLVPGNLAGPEGIINEGFGVPSYYVPNRRLNERFERDDTAAYPLFRYHYDCDGPNIKGLQVTRTMEVLPNEASLRVTWSIRNGGTERQWVAPWVRNSFAPGATVDAQDRLDLPTLDGVRPVTGIHYYSAARNWIAATDPVKASTVYAVFDANDTHAFRAEWEPAGKSKGVQTHFVPHIIEAGDTWSTTYRINVVRGLKHVDFATDEFAAQLEYSAGKLVILMSPAQVIAESTLHASVVAADGQTWPLPKKRFSFTPNRLVRATYEWTPPRPGSYAFLAQMRLDDEPLLLGKNTSSPHGGIDTQFVVGNPASTRMEAWTDAPYALQQGERTFTRALLRDGDLQIWQESSLNKVFRGDQVEASTPAVSKVQLRLARNERESFQLVLRPKPGAGLENLQIQCGTLRHRDGGAELAREDIRIHAVQYHDIRIPSHYEGPTGLFPDALPAYTPQTVPAGQATPVWITVYARPDLPAGLYQGYLELSARGLEPLELPFTVEVYDFTLPAQPEFKTDFVFDMDNGAPTQTQKLRYVQNAQEHRVTLRELQGLPEPQSNYGQVLDRYWPNLQAALAEGQTTVSVPRTLLQSPEYLKVANQFIVTHQLQTRAFVHLAHEPREASWSQLQEMMNQWKASAPDIPVMVTTTGLHPFLHEEVDRWVPHLQLFDTSFNRHLLDRISSDQEVWWYINHAPPRPYSNLFVDFPAMEHRMLFWQAWALGVKGMHYWAINYVPPGQRPEDSILDITPVNGDGLLVYPTPDGPINSIRWENIRDGIEDYDYLTLFRDRYTRLQQQGGATALLERADKAYNLKPLVPNLLQFTRDPATLMNKRHELAQLIEAMDQALK